jgi:phospholipid transport system substrate-binding protein
MRFGLNAFAAIVLVSVATLPPAAEAAQSDPAAGRIEAFYRSLVEVMKQGPALGAKGRIRRLEPVVQDTFDLPLMTRYSVGPSWASMSESDRQAVIRAFTRLTVASYAHNFDRFDGERFDVNPDVQTRGPDKVVLSHLTPRGRAPVDLTYRMRLSGGEWKVVDIYYGAISQLTTRRSDFAAPLASGGARALVAHLEAASDKLLQ